MKKIILYIFAGLVLFVSSCKKDVPIDTTRGAIVSQTFLGTFPTSTLTIMLYAIEPGIASQIKPKYDVELYKIVYQTISPDQKVTQASGLLVIPKGATNPLPLAAFFHGTMLQKNDVPSQIGANSTYEVGLIFATEGYAIVLPDYLGLGVNPGLHPYIHAASEASASIDMMRAGRNFLNSKSISSNGQVFIMGYSQGGHVCMAVHKAIEQSYSNEFAITASAPMAGPYDLSGTQMDYILRDSAYAEPGFLPYALYGLNPIYNIFANVNNAFVAPYNTSLQPFFDGNGLYDLSNVDAILPASQIPSAILTPQIINDIKTNPNHPLRMALKDNDLYNWTPKAQMHLYHCDCDVHVPIQNTYKARDYFLQNGFTNFVVINPLPGGNHVTCALPSIMDAKKWFDSLKQ